MVGILFAVVFRAIQSSYSITGAVNLPTHAEIQNDNNDEDNMDTAGDDDVDWTDSVDKQTVKKNDLQRATFIPLGSDKACLVTDQRNCSQISVDTKCTA